MIDKVPTGSPPAPSSESPAEDSGTFPRITTQSFGRHEILQIILDSETAAKLREPKQHAIVRDADGKLLGVFSCMTPEEAELYQLALDTVDVSESIKHATDPRPGRTLQDILGDLQTREQAECASP